MATTGGAIIAQMLKASGVSKVFGIPDGSYVGLCAGIADVGLQMVTPRHEASALHMAGAYARLSGTLGVAMASNGPGVANALGGVAVENAEGNRVLLITSSRRTGITYPDRGGTYQYFDQVAAIKPISKWSATVQTVDRLPHLLKAALRECFVGRPGVVHLDIAENVINGKTKETALPVATVPLHGAGSYASIARAAKLLAEAKMPAIHAGGGVLHSQAWNGLARVAEALHAPVTMSWSGRGAMDERHPLAWPMTAIEANNTIRNEADVILILGSRVGETDWWGKRPNWAEPGSQTTIQVDLDESAIGRNKPVAVEIVGDIAQFLGVLEIQLEQHSIPQERRSLVSSLAEKRDAELQKLKKPLGDDLDPMVTAHVADVCDNVLDDDAVIVLDGGNTAVWGHFYHQLRTPNTLLHTSHMGMLGAGMGQALGAAEARPNTQVVCLIGDGAFGMHMAEVETAVRNGNSNLTFIVVTDKQWGMVKMSQSFALKPVKTVVRKSLSASETINTDLGETAYDQLAIAMGAHGARVSTRAGFKAALEEAIATNGPSVIHVDVDPVKHMWAPALREFKKMHQEPEG